MKKRIKSIQKKELTVTEIQSRSRSKSGREKVRKIKKNKNGYYNAIGKLSVASKKMEWEGSPSESAQHNLIRATRVYDKRRRFKIERRGRELL